jgi:hypothetical protein|tara:strand:+ start:264 stop:437 length:174 start_codon:yes stop_codon:yes gene_type:complete
MKTQQTISTFLAKQLEILETEKRIDNIHFNNSAGTQQENVAKAKQIIMALATANWNK